MSPRLDIDALRALQAIDQCGGVTRAAQQLALSQSAVSHKIKRLEKSIGSALLSRQAGAAVLTDTGRRLLAYANRILSLHDEAVMALSKRSLAGKIRLGMTEDITGSGLSRILGRFSRLFPEIEVRTHVAQSLVLQGQLEAGDIDVAVMQVFTTDVRSSDRVLSRDQLCWARAVDLEFDPERPVPFLSYDDNCFYRKWMLEHVAAPGRPFQTVLECTSNAGILAGIEAGLGVSIICRRHLTPDMSDITEAFTRPPDIAYVVRKASGSNAHAVQALIDEIDREAGSAIRLDAA